jgi:hypothetical protein
MRPLKTNNPELNFVSFYMAGLTQIIGYSN